MICHLPTALEEDARAAIAHFWITHLAPHLDLPGPILFWTAALEPTDERRLWLMLADAAAKDTGKPLRVLDLTPDPLWNEGAPMESLVWLNHPPSTTDAGSPLLLRAASLPQHDLRTFLPHVNHWIAAVAGQRESLHRAMEFRQLTDAYLPACAGTIAWTERPQGRIREAADAISCFLAKRFS